MANKGKLKPQRLYFFPPWFLNKTTMRKIEALLPHYYHKRLRFYFDLYGCIRCSRTNVIYSCSGLCLGCKWTVDDRLRRSDRKLKRAYGQSPKIPSALFLKRFTTAQELLKDLNGSTRS
jgi:hypothetical protein